MGPTLLIDTNYLSHRAFHAMKGLSYQDMATGAVFGVLQDIISLQDMFKTTACVFAFDVGRGLRHDILPTYKSTRRKRHEDDDEEARLAREALGEQIRALREDYLPAAGFANVFSAYGYEADDIIAAIAAETPGNKEAVIVSADQDLWQCLRENVYNWSPHRNRAYTIDTFRKDWGIEPRQWASVKALAGCSSDDVPGVAGVGDKTAAKFLRGELGKGTKAYASLMAARALHKENMKIVKLPFPGLPEFTIGRDTVTEVKWQELADRLGMRSIRSKAPRSAGKKSKGRKREGGFGLGN